MFQMQCIHSLLYYPVQWFYDVLLFCMKVIRPAPSFEVQCGQHLEEIGIKPFEKELEKIDDGKTFIFEGSTAEGDSIYLHLTMHKTAFKATLFLISEGQEYSTQLKGTYDSEEGTLRAAGLLIEVREAFRRWRVSYKGHLRTNKSEDDTFVSFSGWWKPLSDARYFYANISACAVKTANLLCVKTNMETINSLVHSPDIVQFGQLLLEMSIGGSEPREVRFRGSRQIQQSNVHDSQEEFAMYLKNGERIFYRISTQNDHQTTVDHGLLVRPDSKVRAVQLNNKEAMNIHNHLLINFKPAGMPTFPIHKQEVLGDFTYTQANKVITVTRVKVNYALSTGIAILRTVNESFDSESEEEITVHQEITASRSERTLEVVPFTHRACQDKSYTGGKGANLARLSSIQNQFIVPTGLVVTTTAFENHVRNHPEVAKKVQKLGSHGLSLPEYVTIGEEIQSLLKQTLVEENLSRSIHKLISSQEDVKFAVRSSAVGEDGSDLSSAGQLESLLNVQLGNISQSIIECWCSNFRKEVITYRRNYGQVLNPPMAVVVQEMVNNGVAGVMFTCDPVKNDDNVMVINAIKGMGEDIVSGVVTPDEIRVSKRNMDIAKPSPCCLSDEALSNVISVGRFLAEEFGSEQDVEFVVKDTQVFVVQSRNVTGRDRESLFELNTEFDDGTLTDKEIFSTANLGEVVGFSQSPFEVSQLADHFNKIMCNMVMKDLSSHLPRQVATAFHTHRQRFLFNIGEMFLRQHEVFKRDRLPEISLGGQPLFTDEMFKMGAERYETLPKMFPMKRMYVMLKAMFIDSYTIQKEIEERKIEIMALTPVGDITIDRLFEIAEKQLYLQAVILELHTKASMLSSITYILVGMLIRGSDQGDMSQEMLSDLAKVFSSNTSEVVSADIPSSLKKLATAIVDDQLDAEFSAVTEVEAIKLIESRGKKSKEQLGYFLTTHGHRGPKELYLRADGWGDKPETIVSTLKLMISSPEETKIQSLSGSVIDTLSCKPKGLRRWMMQYLVGETHRGVACREHAKSILVRATYEVRRTVKRIGTELNKQGLIPDEDLLFFFTTDELRTLYATRSAKLISRALRRRQIFPDLEKHQYEHVYWGNPEPINNSNNEHLASLLTLSGTVVCEGKVIARARVAHSLEEAKDTQPGEILITKCTDICWSPYFPIIKGIVTEIGGLLSHGAVVAREYGLPCLIAVEHATQVFKTGDLVELNTYQGKISKLEQEN